jgi:hypothetical protein
MNAEYERQSEAPEGVPTIDQSLCYTDAREFGTHFKQGTVSAKS